MLWIISYTQDKEKTILDCTVRCCWFSLRDVHWVRTDLAIEIGESLQVMARIRYRQNLEHASLYATTEGLYVAFESPQSAITEGQFVAWYLEDELVGSGVIS